MSLTTDIKAYALDLGFCKVGITDTEEIPFYQDIIEERGEDYTPWINGRILSSDPRSEMEDARSAIVLAYDYLNVSYPEELTKMIGRAYLSRSYIPREDSIHGARLVLFEKFLKEKGLKVKKAALNIPFRQLARKAGIASFGKNNFSYVDAVGSFVILYVFLVDQALDYDEPERMSKCPKDCHRCMDACPTQAIVEPFHVIPSRCVGYNNWMRRKDEPGKFNEIIPEEIRPLLGTRIHGCDACQEACLRNANRLKTKLPKDPFLENLKKEIRLERVLLMDDDYYKESIYPIMYNYLTEKKYFQRNAAVAIGNTKDPKYLPCLERAMQETEELVRIHVVWAIAQIGGEEAEKILVSSKSTETSEKVLEEIKQKIAQFE